MRAGAVNRQPSGKPRHLERKRLCGTRTLTGTRWCGMTKLYMPSR
jgi:hypothetical protein